MRKLLTAALLAGSVGFVTADEPKKPAVEAKAPTKTDDKKPDEKKADDKKPEKKGTPKEQFEALSEKFKKKNAELMAEFQKAKTNEEKTKIRDEYGTLATEINKEAMILAKDHAKEDFAVEALMLGMQTGRTAKTQKDAKELLLGDMASNAKIIKLLPNFGRGKEGEKFFKDLVAKTTNGDVKAAVTYYGIAQEAESIDQPEDDEAVAEEKAKEKFTAICAKLDALVASHGTVKIPEGRKEITIADASKKLTFFLNNLVVGKVLPDIETENLDGKKVKISDYRGKVVVLDIWATWCGPCRAMIPHERELVKELKDKPFAFISVSADAQKETLTKFLEKEEMPWTHWWDGQGGKLTEQYQVQFFPTIYVIDAKGVIRFKHVREKKMDEAVIKLLKEVEGGSKK